MARPNLTVLTGTRCHAPASLDGRRATGLIVATPAADR